MPVISIRDGKHILTSWNTVPKQAKTSGGMKVPRGVDYINVTYQYICTQIQWIAWLTNGLFSYTTDCVPMRAPEDTQQKMGMYNSLFI